MRNPRRADILLREAEVAKERGLREAERFLLDRATDALRPKPVAATALKI